MILVKKLRNGMFDFIPFLAFILKVFWKLYYPHSPKKCGFELVSFQKYYMSFRNDYNNNELKLHPITFFGFYYGSKLYYAQMCININAIISTLA